MNYRINENLCQAKLSIIRRISDLALENKKPYERDEILHVSNIMKSDSRFHKKS